MKRGNAAGARVRLVNRDGHAIGVDIGATAVRAAVLQPRTVDGRSTVTAVCLDEVELPRGAVVNGVVSDPAAVTTALKQLWAQNKLTCRNVILGVTNQQVVVREVSLPNLPADKHAQALPFQAREIIALPIEQAVLDFIPFSSRASSTDKIPGLLVAAPREPISVAVNAVEAARLAVARVDLAPFGALRSVAGSDLSVEAVADLGAHLTSVVMHNRGVAQLVRTVARGGQGLTEHLASRLGLEPFEAEHAKCHHGLTGPDTAVTDALTEAVRPLVAEIRSSMQLFSNAHPDAPVERLSLTGRAALLPGLTDVLADQLGMPVDLITSMRNVAGVSGSPPSGAAAASAVSIGLAMGVAA